MRIQSIILSIKNFLFLSVSHRYRKDFDIYIDKINASRAKVISSIFIFFEIIVIAISLTTKKEDFFKTPNNYYGAMYFTYLIVMTGYYLVFTKLQKKADKGGKGIVIAGISFTIFILLWCAVISLLDQLSYGQVIVYIAAIMSVSVLPLFKPIIIMLIYAIPHTIFMILLPYFQPSYEILYGNYINTTSLLIIGWAISCVRYINQVNNFNNVSIIKEKNRELERLNKELEEANKKLERQSQTDSLTGIYNRLVFDNKIISEWVRCGRYSIPLSLIMIDIDYFKYFNDIYGHQAGDKCIKQVAGVLSACARRKSDIVARYGGEEFAVILPHTEKEKALELAEQMRSGVEALKIDNLLSPISQYITISLGVYTAIPSHSSTVDEFIRIADEALYKAKQNNRNRVVSA